MTQPTYPRALTIAGSDSGGGAGIQADLKTFAALECYGMSVPVALTAQNTRGVTGIAGVDPEFIALQIDAVFDDIGVDAVKIGMLGSAAVIEVVADRLGAHLPEHVVLDPVMVAKGGDRLLEGNAVTVLRDRLFPLASVITPNLHEVEALLGHMASTASQMEGAARELLALGPGAVVVKGGHLHQASESDDCLVWRDSNGAVQAEWFGGRRVDTRNTHGTGCTFSSAIAAHLARGASMSEAVAGAKRYVQRAIEEGARYRLGDGHGPVHHFHAWWEGEGGE